MDMSGCLIWAPVFCLIQQTAIGCTPISAGHGFHITHGDGVLFTTGGGFIARYTARCGSRVTNGAQDGLYGEAQTFITAGRQWGRAATIMCHTASGRL